MKYKIAAVAAAVMLGAGTLAACAGEEQPETKSCDEWTEHFIDDGTFAAEDEIYADLGCQVIDDELPQYDTNKMTQQEYSDAFADASEWLDGQIQNGWNY